MQKRRILITAIRWTSKRDSVLNTALGAAHKKYKGNMVVIVGYTAPGFKIASIATAHGFSVQMFAPDIKVLTGDHIETYGDITITSSSQGDYLKYLVGNVDAVMAFDKGDPVVLAASRLKKPVWYPESAG